MDGNSAAIRCALDYFAVIWEDRVIAFEDWKYFTKSGKFTRLPAL